MEFDLQPTQIIMNPDLTDEQKQEALAAFNKHFTGLRQQNTGEMRREFTDEFLKLLRPDSVKALEDQIQSLQGITNPEKLRTSVIMLMAEAFEGGLMFGKCVTVAEVLGLDDKYKH